MLVPQAFLAALCVGFGLFPGSVLRVLGSVMASLPGLQPQADMGRTARGDGHPVPGDGPVRSRGAACARARPCSAGLAVTVWMTRRAGATRRVPTWGCGGELTARTEYTATAFSKPLMMIFDAVYRPTRQVESLATVSPYFPEEVRYHAEIENTFERYVYGPLVRGIFRLADGMNVLQAGSLHAYLAYVIALVVSLVLLVWWRS